MAKHGICVACHELVDVFDECFEDVVGRGAAGFFEQPSGGDLLFADAFEEPELLRRQAEERRTVQICAQARGERFEHARGKRGQRHRFEEIDAQEAQEFLLTDFVGAQKRQQNGEFFDRSERICCDAMGAFLNFTHRKPLVFRIGYKYVEPNRLRTPDLIECVPDEPRRLAMPHDEFERRQIVVRFRFVTGGAIEFFVDDLEVRGPDAAQDHRFERRRQDEASRVVAAAPNGDEFEDFVEELAGRISFAFIEHHPKRIVSERSNGFVNSCSERNGQNICGEEFFVFGEHKRVNVLAPGLRNRQDGERRHGLLRHFTRHRRGDIFATSRFGRHLRIIGCRIDLLGTICRDAQHDSRHPARFEPHHHRHIRNLMVHQQRHEVSVQVHPQNFDDRIGPGREITAIFAIRFGHNLILLRTKRHDSACPKSRRKTTPPYITFFRL